MSHTVGRRTFLRDSALIGVAISLQGCTAMQTTRSQSSLPYKLSLAEWSLHRALHEDRLEHVNFSRTAREDFGIDTVEYVSSFFKAHDEPYLQRMKRIASDHGVASRLIMVDGEGSLGDPDDAKRARAIDNHRKWLDAAAALGCETIRVNAASKGSRQQQHDLVVDGLGRLVRVAEPYGLNVIVENHGGLSSDGSWLAGVIKAVGHPRCGTLPDFGNFRISEDTHYDRYKGVAEMMPYAKAVSAKSYDFDEHGEETTIDYHRMMRIVLAAGYHAHVGIEYEGDRLSEPEGIRATKRLLEKVGRSLKS